MTLKEFLKRNPIITLGELALLMYPNIKTAKSRLTNKLNGNTGQRVTSKDIELAKEVLEKHMQDLKADLSELQPNDK